MNSSNLFDTIRTMQKTGIDIKGFAEKYPWCSVAQLSLLHHYKKNNSDHFQKQAQKTALFFNNKNWLNWQLHLLSKHTEEENILVEIPKDETFETINSEELTEHISTTPESLKTDPLKIKTTEPLIEFEPLHTTDYFASQGIKITDEPVTQDKLGTQMKSFTEWLKSMKKINKETLPTGRQDLSAGDDQTDKSIQQIAEHSNEAAEVVTESMADVLLKQDKKDKAIEVYRKLSLINPSKSAYFAAKINKLSSDSQI